MLVLKKTSFLQFASRPFHSKCSRFGPAQDPGYFGLFDQQEQQSPPQAELAHDDAHAKREQLRLAFRDKIREWARTTPPEYISRPPSRLRSHRRKPAETHERKEVEKTDENDNDADDEEEDDDDVDVDVDDELDVVDDDDELDALDREDEDNVDKDDGGVYHCRKHVHGSHDEDIDNEKKDIHRKSGEHRPDDDTINDDKARRKLFPCDPQNDGRGDGDEELYYYTEKGQLKYKPIHIIAPKDEIYQRLSQSGLVSSRLKRPLPVLKLVKKTDAEIVGWYYYCSIELLQFFRICHNLKEVKAIVEYHIRWSAIGTLAKKYRCNAREIVKKYGRDLECEDKKGKKVRLMTRQEIKEVARGVNKRVQMYHRFLALNILDEMD